MLRDEELKWLAGLKAGDTAGVSNRAILQITRVTATLIVCDHMKFRRTTGHRIGGGPYDHNWLHPVTEQLRDRMYRGRLVHDLTHAKWGEVPTGTLQQVAVLYARAVAGHE